MRSRHLGSQITVSELGLGCMGMSDFYLGGTDAGSRDALHRALDCGITLFDTADFYGPLTNELLLGELLAPFKNQVVISTKVGRLRGPDGKKLINAHPDYIKRACESSLRRLKMSSIDLYYLHRIDRQIPIEESVGAMADLVVSGKVRFIGLSEVAPQLLVRAHRVHPISALQTEYSLWSREPEGELLSLTAQLNIGFVAYAPLGRGFLAGRFREYTDIPIDDYRRQSPRFSLVNFDVNASRATYLTQLASAKGATKAQLALSWLLHKANHIVPLFGTVNSHHVEENAQAVNLQLSDEEMRELDAHFPLDWAVGARYPTDTMPVSNTD
jgi:aryl-alcohol dehydrogenase-like predicted oxidoreductase